MVWSIEKFIKVKIKMLKIIVSYKTREAWHWSIERRLSFFSIFYEYKDPIISIIKYFHFLKYFPIKITILLYSRTSLTNGIPISCINVNFNYEPSYVTLFSNTNSSSFYLFSLSCSSFVPYSWVFLRYHSEILMHYTFIFADYRLL